MARQVCRLASDEFNFAQKIEIGRGSLGKVLSVSWKDKRVAVKVFYQRGVDDNEAAILTKVAHKNIVDFYGVVSFKNKDCIVTELADYGSLATILYGRESSLTVTKKYLLQWTVEIAQGLTYLHSDLIPGICHSDLKSDNILIFAHSQDPYAKICDFGVAKELAGTATAHALGSPLWSAPEVLNMEAHSLLSDVWSFGATLVEMFTGQKPYTHINERDKNFLSNVKAGRLNPLSEMTQQDQSKIPPIIRDFLDSCFEANRANRISMKDIVSRLTDGPRLSQSGSTGDGSASEVARRRSTSLTVSKSQKLGQSGDGSASEVSRRASISSTSSKSEQTQVAESRGTQVAPQRVAGASASASASRRIHRFRIKKDYGDWKDFDLDVSCEGVPLGKDLRSKLAEQLGQTPKKLRLRQYRATRRSDGAKVVDVFGGWKFADLEGNEVSGDELDDPHLHVIRDDEKVGAPGALRALIDVRKI